MRNPGRTDNPFIVGVRFVERRCYAEFFNTARPVAATLGAQVSELAIVCPVSNLAVVDVVKDLQLVM